MSQKLSNKFLKIAIILAIIFFVLVGIIMGVEKYKLSKGTKEVEKLAENLKKMQELDYQLAMADTYGGKTPQETLEMFISAIEKGDYELASKYFVIAKQEEKMKNFKNLLEAKDNKSINFKNEFLNLLKQDLKSLNAEYSKDKQTYSIYTPTKIDFILYPNGIWKIIEI